MVAGAVATAGTFRGRGWRVGQQLVQACSCYRRAVSVTVGVGVGVGGATTVGQGRER